MGVRTSNAKLMAHIAQRRDTSEVKDPRTSKDHKLTRQHDQAVFILPTKTATHIIKMFPGDVGSPMAELSNKLFKDIPKLPPPPEPPTPPEHMDLDAAARSKVKQARKRRESR